MLNIHKTLVYGLVQIIFKHKVKYSIVAMALTKDQEDMTGTALGREGGVVTKLSRI